ncbi:MAG: radical SAM protein [Candidatus Omnitrophota bacterium]
MAKRKRLFISICCTCQYRCEFCIYVRTERHVGLTVQEWGELLVVARENGFEVLEIGGRGEPTLSPDFFAIVVKARALGYVIEVLSNAQNPDVLLNILPMISKLTINLNSTCEDGFQQIHRPKKRISFNQCQKNIGLVLAGISKLKSHIDIFINFVVYRDSLQESLTFPLEINKLFSSYLNPEKLIFVYYQHKQGYEQPEHGDGLNLQETIKYLSLWETLGREDFFRKHTNMLMFIEKTRRMLDRLSRTPAISREKYACDIYRFVRFVDSNGDIFACYNPFRVIHGLNKDSDPYYCGNMHTHGLGKIFHALWQPQGAFDLSGRFWSPCLFCAPHPVAIKSLLRHPIC